MRIHVELTGITPLICNRFTDAAAMAASSGSRASSAAADRGTPLEIAESKLYPGLNGKPMIPQPNLLRSIIDGGSFFKVGKSQLTTKSSSSLYSCVMIDEAEIPLIHSQPWKVDSRAVVIPATKGRILAHRPMFDDWKLDFEIEIDLTQITEKLFRQVVDAAGNRIGLGDFRPQRKGPYGRYVVTHWAEVEQQVLLAAE